MAKILNPLMSQAVSGKVIAVIHQAWRGLNVVRKFTMPTIRHTSTQMFRRSNFGTLSGYWKNVLTIIQRATWNILDLNIKDLWGNDIRTTGLNAYQRINGILLDAGKTLLTDAPISSAMASPIVTPTFISASSKIVITKPTAGEVTEYSPFVDIWVAGINIAGVTAGDVTEIKTSGISASINPAQNIFRHVQFIDENSTTDQTVNFANLAGAALAGGIKIACMVIRYTKDGMKSVPVRIEEITVA